MTKQQRSLKYLIERCREIDPNCAVHLQGSVARGKERSESDVDVTIVLTTHSLHSTNQLITPDNHFRMVWVHLDDYGVDVDIHWVREAELRDSIHEHGVFSWYMFLTGRPIHDPTGTAKRCQRFIKEWFERNPAVLEAWNLQQAEVDRNKRDRNYRLMFRTQPEFCRHLRSLE